MLKNLLKSFIFFTLISLGMIQSAQAFSVSEDEVNNYLAKKGEIADKLGFPGLFSLDYKLNNLTTRIGQNNSERVEISGAMDSILGIQKQELTGKLNLTIDTIPYYDAEKGAVYLRDIRILKWSGEPQKYMEQLQPIMPFINQGVAALMMAMPIHTLDESKPRDALIKKFAKGIRVEQGRLSLDAGVL